MKQATPEMATVRAILAATVLLAILSCLPGAGRNGGKRRYPGAL